MKIRKIYVVAGTHGNETFGLKVLAQLKALQNPSIVTKIANPQALLKKKRSIETDLNRCFALKPERSLEAKLAVQIKNEIASINPDLIIDLHTSTVKVNRVAILADKNPFLVNTAKHLGVRYVAVMPKSISSQALIGVEPQKSLCIELGRGLRSNSLAQELAKSINSLVGTTLQDHKMVLPLLTIERIIQKAEAPGLVLENYIFNEKLNGYPFLAGETNYTEHRGFLATSQIEV